MRVLYIINYYKPAYTYGGPVKSVSTMCEALARLGVQVTVLTTNANGSQRLDVPHGESVYLNGVEVYYYPVDGKLLPSFFYSPGLARACDEKIGQCELAILETFFTHAMGPAVKACKRLGIPYIVPLRGQLLPWSLKQKRLKKALYLTLLGRTYLNNAAALHCTVHEEAVAARKLKIPAPSFVVPNGVDCGHFVHVPSRGSLRRSLGIPEHAQLLLFLGRLHPKKRPEIAVEALAASQSLPGQVHLLLAGPDESQLTGQLKEQARSLGCAERLHITGLIQGDDTLSALADADLLLMPSEPASENFGMAALEAMAAGLPILVSEGVPIGRWAELAGAGRMIPCSANAFNEATRELLAAPELLRKMGREGQALAYERFDVGVVAQLMAQQYHSIVTSGLPLADVSQLSHLIKQANATGC